MIWLVPAILFSAGFVGLVWSQASTNIWVWGSGLVFGPILMALGAVALGMMLLLGMSKPARSQDTPEIRKQIRSDCQRDALRYCPKQAARCAVREDQRCKDAIIPCMSANKAKLNPDCARWIW